MFGSETFPMLTKNPISGGKINNITYCEKSSVIYLLSAFRFLLTAEYWTLTAPQSNITLIVKSLKSYICCQPEEFC